MGAVAYWKDGAAAAARGQNRSSMAEDRMRRNGGKIAAPASECGERRIDLGNTRN
jgi:hypothetical protein